MTERGDFSAEFDKLVSPLLDEERDPVVLDVLADATELECDIAQDGYDGVAAARIDELNDKSKAAGMLQNAVKVTGRIRSYELIDVEDDDDLAVAKENLNSYYGYLGELKEDEYGYYFDASLHDFMCGEFAIDAGDDEEREKRMVLYFNHPTVDAEDDLMFAYVSDITALHLETPSTQKIEQDIWSKYPEIARQLEALPYQSDDDDEIITALKDFELRIDWRDYPHHDPTDRQELRERIAAYITERVGFDDAPYKITVRDYLYGRDYNNKLHEREIDGKLKFYGTIDDVILRMENAAQIDGARNNDTVYVFRPMLEITATAAGRYNGSYKLYAPIASVVKAKSLRNEEFIDSDVYYNDDPAEPEIVPAFTSGDYGAVADFDAAPRMSRKQELEAVKDSFDTLLYRLRFLTSALYDTEEEAKEAQYEVKELLDEFSDNYPYEFAPVIEASGAGVMSMDTTYDPEGIIHDITDESAVYLRINNAAVRTGDEQAKKQGMYSDYKLLIAQGVHPEDRDSPDSTPRYAILAHLLFTDVTSAPSIKFVHGSSTMSYFVNHRTFMVRVDGSNVTLTIPEYDKLMNGGDDV